MLSAYASDCGVLCGGIKWVTLSVLLFVGGGGFTWIRWNPWCQGLWHMMCVNHLQSWEPSHISESFFVWQILWIYVMISITDRAYFNHQNCVDVHLNNHLTKRLSDFQSSLQIAQILNHQITSQTVPLLIFIWIVSIIANIYTSFQMYLSVLPLCTILYLYICM